MIIALHNSKREARIYAGNHLMVRIERVPGGLWQVYRVETDWRGQFHDIPMDQAHQNKRDALIAGQCWVIETLYAPHDTAETVARAEAAGLPCHPQAPSGRLHAH